MVSNTGSPTSPPSYLPHSSMNNQSKHENDIYDEQLYQRKLQGKNGKSIQSLH